LDLALHLRVLSRHRVLLAVGFTAAVALALLSYVRIGPDGVEYRKQEHWRSVTRLFVAERGYPFRPTGSSNVDPTTFAVIAAQFANSDAVLQTLKRDPEVSRGGKVNGIVEASPLKDLNDQFLPFIEVAGIGPSPSAAQSLARRAAAAISTYVEQRQTGVPPRRQVTLQLVSRPSQPELLEGRPKGTTLFLFLAIVSLTFVAVYVLENIRGTAALDSTTVGLRMESSDGVSSPRDATLPVAQRGFGEGATPRPLALSDRGSRARQPDDDEVAQGSLESTVERGASARWRHGPSGR
jgi:hypothetical protein